MPHMLKLWGGLFRPWTRFPVGPAGRKAGCGQDCPPHNLRLAGAMPLRMDGSDHFLDAWVHHFPFECHQRFAHDLVLTIEHQLPIFDQVL